ncbi:MAG: carboxypeptidase regulatory-like domain-containing protein [Acidobacteriota bacterium]
MNADLAGLALASLIAASAHGAPLPERLVGRMVTPGGEARSDVRVEAFPASADVRPTPWPDVVPESSTPLAVAETDETGRFSFSTQALGDGPFLLRTSGPDLPTTWRRHQRLTRDLARLDEPLEIAVFPAAELVGTVLDQHESTVGAARVRVMSEGPFGVSIDETSTDAAGRFQLAVPALARCYLIAREGHRVAGTTTWSTPPGPTRVVLRLVESDRLRARIVDVTEADEERPLAGAAIGLRCADQVALRREGSGTVIATEHADENGLVDLELPHACRAWLAEPGHPPARLDDGDVLLTARADRTVRFLDAKDRPLTDLRVRHALSDLVFVTDSKGRVRLPDDDSSLQLTRHGLTRAREPHRLGTTHRWRDRRVSGRVVTRNGETLTPVADALVSVGNATLTFLTTTDAAGSFQLTGLPEGTLDAVARRGEQVVRRSRFRGGDLLLAPAASSTVSILDDDRSITGAWLTATPLTGHEQLPLRWGRAAGSGRHRLEALVPGSYSLLAITSDGRRASDQLGHGDASSPTLKLGPTPVRVRVRDPSGRPLAHVEVESTFATETFGELLAPSHVDGLLGTRFHGTGNDGVVMLSVLPAGRSLTIQARRPGWTTAWTEQSAPAEGRGFAPVEITMAPAATLRGRVLSLDGEPLADARVVVNRQDPVETEQGRISWWQLTDGRHVPRTDDDGRFELDWLPPGRYEVEAGKEGWLPAGTESLELHGGDVVDLVLELDPGASLTGRVVDESGVPVGGAEVKVEAAEGGREQFGPTRYPKTTSDVDGGFVLRGLPADRELHVQARHHDLSLTGRTIPTRADEGPLTLVLTARASLDLHVTLEGDPVTGAWAQCHDGESGRGLDERGDGWYRLTDLGAGTWTCRAVDLSSGARGERAGITLAEGERHEVEMTLAPPTAFDVVVRDSESGLAIEGARLDAEGATSITDATGSARVMVSTLRDEARLRVSSDDHRRVERKLSLADAPGPVTIELAPKVTLAGRCVDENGEPLARAAVSGAGWALSDAEGRFELDDAQPGVFVLTADGPPGTQLRAELEVELPPEGRSDVVLVLRPPSMGTVQVSVVDTTGEAVAEARVALHDTDGRERASGLTEDDGTWRSESVREGWYSVRASRDAQSVPLELDLVEVVQDTEASVEVTLREGAWIDGRVLRDGQPVASAEIRLRSAGESRIDWRLLRHHSLRKHSSTDGSFTLGPLDREWGSVVILVQAPTPLEPGDRRELRRLVDLGTLEGDRVTVDLDLQGVSIGGRVTSLDGPVVGATVEAHPVGSGSTATTVSSSTQTGEDGRFVLRGLEDGQAHELRVRHRDGGTARATVEAPDDDVQLELAARWLTGSIFSPDGRPEARSFYLWLARPDGVLLGTRWVTPDAEGSFRVPLDWTGRLLWAAGGGTHPRSWGLHDGGDVIIRRRVGGHLQLTVTEDGRPVHGARCTALRVDGQPIDGEVLPQVLRDDRSNVEGVLSASQALGPGRYELRVTGPDGLASAELVVEVESGRFHEHDVGLTRR